MKNKAGLRISVALTVALCVFIAAPCALAAFGVDTGTVLTAASPYGLTLVMPEGLREVQGNEAFHYGYADDNMLVAVTPMSQTDFDTFASERMGEDFATETRLKLKGMDARQYVPKQDIGVDAIFAVQESEGAGILEVAFYPADMDAKDVNQGYIEQVLGSIRSRAKTYEAEQDASQWQILFNHAESGVNIILPKSMVKRSAPMYESSVVEYQNDYLLMLIFAYQATLDEYVDEYEMTGDEFFVSDTVVNGVNVHIYEPRSADVSTDVAYVAIDGKNGVIIELIFGANAPSEEENIWMYVNQIIANISVK